MAVPDSRTTIIEWIFNERWDPDLAVLSDPLVTLTDVSDKIRAFNQLYGTNLSDRNPANFFKDFVRRLDRANERWPPSVTERRYTGVQRTGRGMCFEFIPFAPDQLEPFQALIIRPTQGSSNYTKSSGKLPNSRRWSQQGGKHAETDQRDRPSRAR